MGYLIFGIYFALALLFKNQPHIAVIGIALTDFIAYKTIKRHGGF